MSNSVLWFYRSTRWTIDTKYYSADLSIWTAHLDEGFSFGALPNFKQLAALVMVFDMSDVRIAPFVACLVFINVWLASSSSF